MIKNSKKESKPIRYEENEIKKRINSGARRILDLNNDLIKNTFRLN